MLKHGVLHRLCVSSSTASWQHKGLENTTVADVLKAKGEEKDGCLFSCRTNDTVYDAVQLVGGLLYFCRYKQFRLFIVICFHI